MYVALRHYRSSKSSGLNILSYTDMNSRVFLLQPLLAEHILHQIDALSLSSLQRTSQSTKAHVEAHYAHSFRTLLARYVDDVDGFLYILQRIEGCITGSQALKVIMNDASASWKVSYPFLAHTCFTWMLSWFGRIRTLEGSRFGYFNTTRINMHAL